jgi:methylated-DNA-[protein]-cysteine S-methyltransferase
MGACAASFRSSRSKPQHGVAIALRLCSSPYGPLELRATERGLCGVRFVGVETGEAPTAGQHVPEGAWAILEQGSAELDEYFAGSRRIFAVALDLRGTAFQRSVWEALLRIPYGETITYRQLATAAGHPAAIRAAGAANGANPLPILVPCHRVIGSDGSLTGYGGGLETKRRLLDLERGA